MPEEQVLVVGAGAAGIAAAAELHKAGVTATLLEARDRLGGRVWTDRSFGFPVERGAAWVHGSRGNPLTELARRFQVPTLPNDHTAVLLDSQSRFTPSRDQRWVGVRQWQEDFSRVLEESKLIVLETGTDMPLEEAARQVPRRINQPRLEEAVEWGLGWLSLVMGVDLDRLSAWNWDQDTDLPGSDLIFPRGYDQVLHRLADGLDIRYREVAHRVEWDQASVRVFTGERAYEASRLILTLPLGVWQTGAIEFDPPLPEWKRKAIGQLAMGLLDKVILHFPHTFWPRHPTHFGSFPSGSGHYMGFTDPFPDGYPAVLIAWAAGHRATSLESEEDARVVEGILAELEQGFGGRIPAPLHYAVTRWGSDPFSRGSYSFLPVGVNGTAYDRMAVPVGTRLFFAGEATSRAHPCTVHGAYLSGIREARRIIGLNLGTGWATPG